MPTETGSGTERPISEECLKSKATVIETKALATNSYPALAVGR